ncbi:hypothetical protein [Sphingobacterium sp.]
MKLQFCIDLLIRPAGEKAKICQKQEQGGKQYDGFAYYTYIYYPQ